MFLYEILGIDIGLASFFSFIFGIFIGLTIAFLVYLLVILRGIRGKKNIKDGNTFQIDDNEVKIIVRQTEDMFNDKDLQGNLGNIEYARDLITKMMTNIARKFFPNSKRPLAELSIDEMLVLLKYVSDRLDKVLDRRGVKIFRKLKLSTILGFSDVRSKVEDNEILKATKKYKLNETWRAVRSVTNFVNPVFWARRFIVTKGQSMLIRRICVVTIDIVAEETYKIYSKSVFNDNVKLDTGAETKMDSLSNDLENDFENSTNSSEESDNILALNEKNTNSSSSELESLEYSETNQNLDKQNDKMSIIKKQSEILKSSKEKIKKNSKFKNWFRKKGE